MLASLLYVRFKAGHIVAAKCVFEKLYLQFWVMRVCSILNAQVMVTLCLSIYFVSVKLFYYCLRFQIKIVTKQSLLVTIVFLKITCWYIIVSPNEYVKQLALYQFWFCLKLSFPFFFFLIVYFLGLQHELAHLMHVFWLIKHDAHCSVTENPIVPYLCAFVGTMFMKNKKWFVIWRE